MARRTNDFQSIRSEGGLLPPDLLRRVLDPREKLPGTLPEDYGLPKGERLNEVITQSWNRMRKHWAEFRPAADALAKTEPGTGLTNDRWTVPLLRELGFGLLPTSAGPEVGGRSYAISRFLGPVPVHLVGCGLSLDRRAAGVRGAAAANPHGLVQEFLNRSTGSQWGIVSNGLRFRILRDNQALSRQSFLEFDLETMFGGEVYSDFVLLWLSAHATRFVPREGGRPDTCWLEEWTELAEEQGTRALGELRGGVEKALQILGEGFTSHPKNTPLRDSLRTGQVPLTVFHGQLLRVVYRLIFLFVAEDRTIEGQPLLHARDDSEAARTARERYTAHYGAARLRELAGRIKGSRHGDLWQQFNLIVGALSADERFAAVRQHLALPALGSFLWSPASTSDLNAAILNSHSPFATRNSPGAQGAALTNHDFLESLRLLAFTRQGKVLRPVDYKNLGAEELGGVYESLLALSPQISADGARFTFAEFAGSERKMSGSYYTPDSLVQCLLDSALDPVVEDALKGKAGAEAENALLSLKVSDPAVGSGHFLVGAAHRLARHLARVRAQAHGESEPSPLAHQQALRDVIGRCLYGVDVNPMAAELCRVSLWLEALEPGKPLSFLDHHIRVGNSLLGTTPELIAGGLPDDAFKPIEGDDKKICSALRKRNKQEREGQMDMLHLMVAESQAEYNSIESRTSDLEKAPDDTIEEIRRKAEQFNRLVVSPEYKHAQQLADAWCAAFVWKKEAKLPFDAITTDTIKRLEHDPDALSDAQRKEAERLAAQYRFFHWHLAFPEVFGKGGFDCVLGNPPWERVKLQEKEWFAERSPEIANAPNAAARKRMIESLKTADPRLYKQFREDSRKAEGESHLLRHSGRYPLCGRGDINLYAAFAEAMRNLLASNSRNGSVLPSGIATDDTTKFFFQDLMQSGSLVSIFSFDNKENLFPAVKSSTRFCLITIARTARSDTLVPQFVFYAGRVEHLSESRRRFCLSVDDISLLNPNSQTCPVFRTGTDAELTKNLYRRVPVLITEGPPDVNPLGISFLRMLDMANDSGLFRTAKQLEGDGYNRVGNIYQREDRKYLPLYEAKMTGHFDHRSATYDGNGTRELTGTERNDPSLFAMPRYWVPETEVASRLHDRWDRDWLLGWQDVTDVNTMARTVNFAIMPRVGVGHTAPLIYSSTEAELLRVISANLASFVLDYVARQKIGGVHLTYQYLKQLPIMPPSTYAQSFYWCSNALKLQEWLEPRILELTYTAWDLEPFAEDCTWSGPPFRWDEERRFLLRCELDAAFFHLYLPITVDGQWKPARVSEGAVHDETPEELAGLRRHFPSTRDAVSYIMDTFPIVRRKDEEKYNGDYRTKRVILEIYDEMAEAKRTGIPYKTRLDPPPADSSCCHPKLKIGILAFGSLINDPGDELQRVIRMRIKTTTPFPVEFGRYSGKTRGGGPTLTKHDDGGPVSAEILVLDESVSEVEATNRLWRRERGRTGSGEKYIEGASPNSVLVQKITDDPCVSIVLYTDFLPEGKIRHPNASELAKQAIQSAKIAEKGKDGISYLMNAIASGIKTPLTPDYDAEILKQTGTGSLQDALQKAMTL
jgi:hypothetical protein